MKYLSVYMTTGTIEEARNIGRVLLQERLVACINIVDNMHSMYWWEDEIQDDTEVVIFAKTRGDLFDALNDRVKEIHGYDCPCIVGLHIEQGNPAYLQWIDEETDA